MGRIYYALLTIFFALTIGCTPFNRAHPGVPSSYTSEYRPLTPAEQQQRAAEIRTIHQQEATMPSASILVTAGPLSQPYRALGEVYVNTRGVINLGSILNDTLFRSRFERAVQGPTPTAHIETMNAVLRQEAVRRYGNQVDAVVNVVYRTDPDGDVFASGLAVQFVEEKQEADPAPPATPSLEARLDELKQLREKNLITSEEYYEKRSKLLEGF